MAKTAKTESRGSKRWKGEPCLGRRIRGGASTDACARRGAEVACERKVGDPWKEAVALGPIIGAKPRASFSCIGRWTTEARALQLHALSNG